MVLSMNAMPKQTPGNRPAVRSRVQAWLGGPILNLMNQIRPTGLPPTSNRKR